MRSRHITCTSKATKSLERLKDKWARVKEPGRFANGLTIEEPRHETGFEPYRKALDKLVLPPRFATGDPRNQARAQAPVDAMMETKEKLDPGHYQRVKERWRKKRSSKPKT
ncbi:unnamed protein product, partial [marine sediment metagenome]